MTPETTDFAVAEHGEVEMWEFNDGFPVIALYVPCDVDDFMTDPTTSLPLDDFLMGVESKFGPHGIVPIENENGEFNFGIEINDGQASKVFDYAFEQLETTDLCEGLPPLQMAS